MKTYLFYRSNSEDEAAIRDFLRNLASQGDDKSIFMMDVRHREGAEKANLYGVERYPTLITAKNDGSVVQTWVGVMPLIGEITYYLRQL